MINNRAREITADSYSETRAQINSALNDVHTAIPGIIMSFNKDERTAEVQPAIKRVFINNDGEPEAHDLPPCLDVPVVFPGGGGFELLFNVQEGDECLLIFSERCIDGWYETGDTAEPYDLRRHDLSDAFAIVGVKSKPSLEQAIQVPDSGALLGGQVGSILIADDEITAKIGGAFLSMTADKLETNLEIHCTDVITSKMSLNAHVHAGVEPGGSTTLDGQ